MGFLIPSALTLAALAIPIIIFYMLKLRRQPARVSSLLLWQQVLQDRQANAPWQRLKRNLLLLLQLLILALLVMALARPYFTVQARVQGNVVLLLDASASMQATDIAPNRFAAARAAALDIIDRLDTDDAVTLIAVERTPRILAAATTDHNALRHTLNAARPSNSSADWAAALTLAAANAATLPEATIAIISDGAMAGDEAFGPDMPRLSAPVEFIPIGQQANNQGLVALSLRDGTDGPELFLRVANAASEPVERRVEIQVDGRLFDARQLDLPARDNVGLTLTGLPLDAHQIQTRLAGTDLLAADDIAWVVRSAAPAHVLLVGAGNLFLERALALLPELDLRRATPDQALPQTPFDLIIFDRVIPPAIAEAPVIDWPEGNFLVIAPPQTTNLFEVRGVMTRTRLIHLDRRHPLLNFVELNNLHVARAQAVSPPSWTQSLIEAEGGSLLLAGQTGGRRIAILTFDLHQSDLPLQIDFPILVINLARWLLPGSSTNLAESQTLFAGQSFNLPAASSADAFIIKTPAIPAKEVTIPIASSPDSEQSSTTFNETDNLGIYQVFAADREASEPVLLTEFAVNLLAEAETDIQPGSITLASMVPAGAAAGQPPMGRWEWWWILVLLGLGVLLAEWWIYWRGEVR